jgi:hypothetical protein
MTWLSAALTNDVPTNYLSDAIKAAIGSAPIRNWSFVENIPAGAGVNEVITLVLSGWGTGDTIRVTFNGHETTDVTYAANITTVLQNALIALDDFDTGDVTVAYVNASTYTLTFGGKFTYSIMSDISLFTITNATGDATGVFTVTTPGWITTGSVSYSCDVFKCAGTGDDANDAGVDWYLGILRRGVNEVQTITVGSGGAGDTFTLTYNGHTTGAITWSADNAADIQAALLALDDFAPGDLTVTSYNTDVYRVWFAGTFVNTNVGTITGTGTGCTITIAETVPGKSDESWVITCPFEQYSTVYHKFKRGASFKSGASNSGPAVDANGYPAYSSVWGGDIWYNIAVTQSYGAYWPMTLNKTGFTYEIKMTKNFIAIGFKVGVTEKFCYLGLMDSMVAPAIGDPYPLIAQGNGMVVDSATQGGFTNLPGVASLATVNGGFGTIIAPWTYPALYANAMSNASNANDKWQENKIHVSRALVLHKVTTSSSYLYGFARGLLKSDIMIIPMGGTVNIGDTMTINDDATPEVWTCMGPGYTSGDYYYFTKAE